MTVVTAQDTPYQTPQVLQVISNNIVLQCPSRSWSLDLISVLKACCIDMVRQVPICTIIISPVSLDFVQHTITKVKLRWGWPLQWGWRLQLEGR